MCSRLTRYEIRLLCENTPNLVQLPVADINSLFDRADIERTGRFSVQQFIAQYRLQKRLSAEVHFIADSFISSLNLFEALDSANSGNIASHDLLQYWNKAGLRINEGIAVLKVSCISNILVFNPVMLIRKRRLAKGYTLSVMESEPESIFIRHRRRRLLKRKERRMRHERIASRVHM
uniref:EF-hand domain-containing protein n=1 Tax=Angiostrongylus cantonensis TaxID=6313 RepID=A0A0K0DIN6_ANGCA